MPNGKGSSDWGWVPGPEEIFIFLIVSFISIVFLKAVGLAIITALIWSTAIGLIAGLFLLWGNNGWPGLKK